MDLNLLRRMAGIPTLTPNSITKSNVVANEFRKLAGLSPLPIKEDDKEDDKEDAEAGIPAEEMPAEEMPAEEMPAEEMPAGDLPEIVKIIASQAEGKSVDELISLIGQVYSAGFSDGKEESEHDSSDDSAESSEEESEKIAEEKNSAASKFYRIISESRSRDPEGDAWFKTINKNIAQMNQGMTFEWTVDGKTKTADFVFDEESLLHPPFTLQKYVSDDGINPTSDFIVPKTGENAARMVARMVKDPDTGKPGRPRNSRHEIYIQFSVDQAGNYKVDNVATHDPRFGDVKIHPASSLTFKKYKGYHNYGSGEAIVKSNNGRKIFGHKEIEAYWAHLRKQK